MALTDSQKNDILADFHTGAFSNREIAKKHSVGLGTVNRLVKGLEPLNGSLVEQMVDTTIKKKKEMVHFGSLNGSHQSAVLQVVHEKVDKANILNMFDNSTVKNQTLINDVQQQIKTKTPTEDDIFNLGAISKITETNRKQLFGNTQEFKPKEDDKNTMKSIEIIVDAD